MSRSRRPRREPPTSDPTAWTAAAVAAAILLLPACAILTFPIRLLAAIVSAVFRLGALAVNGLVAVGRAIGPSLLFFVSAETDPSVPSPDLVTEKVRLAAAEPDPVHPDLASALRRVPVGAREAILVDARVALEPDGDRRIARLLRGRRIEGVAFVAAPGEPVLAPPVPLLASPATAEALGAVGHRVSEVRPQVLHHPSP